MGPENRFIQRVHKHLPKEIYREKMHNAYRGGTPDVWYSGKAADLWVEYKWVAKMPRHGVVPALSALQLGWLQKRVDEGRHCWVIVGVGSDGIVLEDPREWTSGVKHTPMPANDVASSIEAWCG